MSYPNSSTSTNILEHLEYNRQTEALMKQLLIAGEKTALVDAYTALIANLTADKVVVVATTDVTSLQS